MNSNEVNCNAWRWNLVADIGGTNARFAVQRIDRDELEQLTFYCVDEYPEFNDVFRNFLTLIEQYGITIDTLQGVCLAIASPVGQQESLRFTNSPWVVSRSELAELLGQVPFEIINDFVAIGYAISGLGNDDWIQVGGTTANQEKPVVVLGPGTGLGVCSVIPAINGVMVIEGEGGHADFAPLDEIEVEIQRYLLNKYDHVSIERLLSGDGILNIYQALCAMRSITPVCTTAAMITDAALASSDETAEETMQIFSRVLGSSAGNLALINGALGGVYIEGGILPRILPLIEQSQLRERFEGKGRFRSYLESIPLRIINRPNLGLIGAIQRLEFG